MTMTMEELEDHWPRLSSAEVCGLAGVTFRQLDYWDRTGILRPGVSAKGSGSQRRWSPAQVRSVWVAGRLSFLGARAPTIAAVVVQLEDWPLRRWHGRIDVTLDGLVVPEGRASADQHYVIDLKGCPLISEEEVARVQPGVSPPAKDAGPPA